MKGKCRPSQVPGDPALELSMPGPPTASFPLPLTAETICVPTLGSRKLSKASVLLLGLSPQPKADG